MKTIIGCVLGLLIASSTVIADTNEVSLASKLQEFRSLSKCGKRAKTSQQMSDCQDKILSFQSSLPINIEFDQLSNNCVKLMSDITQKMFSPSTLITDSNDVSLESKQQELRSLSQCGKEAKTAQQMNICQDKIISFQSSLPINTEFDELSNNCVELVSDLTQKIYSLLDN